MRPRPPTTTTSSHQRFMTGKEYLLGSQASNPRIETCKHFAEEELRRWHLCNCAFAVFVHLCICAFVQLCSCAFVHLRICVFVHLCTCAFVHLSICATTKCAFVHESTASATTRNDRDVGRENRHSLLHKNTKNSSHGK